jgi:hypothetical protein
MKKDDYEQWLGNYKNRVKENIIYHDFEAKTKDFTNSYYEWNKYAFESDHIKTKVTVSVSDNFYDRVETALARLSLSLDKLLAYLHEQKNL